MVETFPLVCTPATAGLGGIPPLQDTHCHLHDDSEPLPGGAPAPMPVLPKGVQGACLMAVSPADWDVVQRTCHGRPRLRPFFGIHPWHAHRAPPGWQARLVDLLRRHPSAGLGEAGLDYAARTSETGRCEREDQLRVFRDQLRIAYELSRPISVHCVRAHGALFDILRELGEAVPPALALHSYSGSPEMASALLRLPSPGGPWMFFGFSMGVNARRAVKALPAVVSRIPQGHLLLESDWHGPAGIHEQLVAMCEALADIRGVPSAIMARECNANAARWLAAIIGAGEGMSCVDEELVAT